MADTYVDYLREKEKRLLCIGICLFMAVAVLGFSPRARFFSSYFGAGAFLSRIFCLAALAFFLGMFLLLIGTARRGRRYMELKEKSRDESRSGSYVSVEALSSRRSGYDAASKKCRRLHTAAVLLGGAAVLLFTGMFLAGDLHALLTELGKPPIERSMSDFRIWANFVGKFFSLAGLCLTALVAARILENRTVPLAVLYLCIGCCALGDIQIAYFYFGDIFVRPPVADLAMLLTLACCAGLCGLAVFTDRKKAQLSAIGNRDFYVYDFS